MTRKLRLRRCCTSLLTLLAFLVSSVEVMFPEVHDGDGAVEVATTRLDGPMVAGVALAHGNAAVVSVGEANSDARSHPAHGWHVEHCGHSYAATNARIVGKTMLRIPKCAAEAPIAKLVSFELPPHVRPPIL